MRADSIFAMGKAHTVCEDYARDGKIPGTERAFAIVSDGCSSSPDTDFGSRFMTVAAIQTLARSGDRFNLGEIIHLAKQPTAGFMSPFCLDATLMMAWEKENGMIGVVAAGDGVIIARKWTGKTEVWAIDQGGAPAYLSYMLDPNRFKEYRAQGYGRRLVTHYVDGEEMSDGRDDTVYMTHDGSRTPAFDGMGFEIELDPSGYNLVMVSSDGLQSFKNMETQQEVPLLEVIPHVMDIRVLTGAFLRRAHNWFLTKTCPKLSWQHTDDFGTAALIVDPPAVAEGEEAAP